MWAVLATGWLLLAPSALPLIGLESFELSGPAAGWAGWGEPFGPAAGRVTLDVVDSVASRCGRVRYERASRHLMLPFPERRLVGTPTVLRLRVGGDRSGTPLSVTLVDATGEWLNTVAVPLGHRGWRDVRLDLTRFRDSAHGNADGVLDPPARLLSLNLEFAADATGEIWFDNLQLEQRRDPPLAYLELDSGGPTGCGLDLPEDPAPVLKVTNRDTSSVPLQLLWRVAEREGTVDLCPAPGETVEWRLPALPGGAHRLAVTLRTADGERRFDRPLWVLPPKLGGPDTFLGYAEHDPEEMERVAYVRDLARLRALGADWTLLALPHRRSEGLGGAVDWDLVAESLDLAWAQDVRVIGCLSPGLMIPGGLNAASRDPVDVLDEADRLLGDSLRGWLLAIDRRDTAEAYLSRLRAARSRLGAKSLLAEVPAAGWPAVPAGATGVMVALEAVDAPAQAGLPRALAVLDALASRGHGLPVWLWGATWPAAAVTGLADPAAATAVLLACARATPRVVALGRDRFATTRPGEADPELVAFAVAARLTGGLRCQGIASPQPGLFVAAFAEADRQVRVAWSETGEGRLAVPAGAQLWDVLGRPVIAAGEVTVGPSPLYLVAPAAEGGSL